MSIKIGSYDFFAHLIGGGFLLANIIYVLQKIMNLPVNIMDLSGTELIIFGVLAYILGFAATPISSRLWYRLFAPKDLYQRTIKQLVKEIPNIKVDFDNMDWYTLVTFIKKQNAGMAEDVERFNAISIMLRSSSFSLLLFCFIFGFDFFATHYLYSYLALSVLCLVISLVLIRASVTWHTYFFRSVHQSIIGLIIKPEELPIKIISEKKS